MVDPALCCQVTPIASTILPQPDRTYAILLCSGERRIWRYLGPDPRGRPWWRDVETGSEFSESSLMYAWQIVERIADDSE